MDEEIRKFVADFNKFMGRMEKFEESTETWMRDTNSRLTNIETEVQNPKFCGAHESLIHMLSIQKDVEQRQTSVNTSQENKNIKQNEWQGKQDKEIRDIQEQDRAQDKIIEFKLNKTQEIQLTVASVVSVLLGIITIYKALRGIP